MGARSSGREAVLQMMYALDATENSPAQAVVDFWREFPGNAEGRPYADMLLPKVWSQLGALDEQIAKASSNWRVERMTRVDRNILRLAAYELKFETEVPRPVIIDEAVELAKQYGADGSPSFVNGVLNQLADSCRPEVAEADASSASPSAPSAAVDEKPSLD